MALGNTLFRRLANQEIIIPQLQGAFVGDNWPDEYTITVDSRPHDSWTDYWFHPSTHCLMSARELFYWMHPEHRKNLMPDRRELQSAMTMAMGSALHAVIQTQLEMIGMVNKEDIEVSLVNEEHHYRGHMDWRVWYKGLKIPTEMKSRNSQAFRIQHQPLLEWVAQLNCYMEVEDAEEGRIVVVESGYPFGFKEFVVRRDRELTDKIFEKWAYVLECVKRDIPPAEKCEVKGGKTCEVDSPRMKSCPARFICKEQWLEGARA